MNVIVEDVSNWFQKARSGKGNGIRFNARTIRIELLQFTSSSKLCEAFRNSNIAPRPSVRNLKRLKKVMTPEEECFPKIYSWFCDAFKEIYGGELNVLIGHMLYDRLKLK